MASAETIVAGALTVVAGLAWNDAINDSIKYYYPFENAKTLSARYTYAIVITLMVVALVWFLQYIGNELEIGGSELRDEVSNLWSGWKWKTHGL
jgi:lysylphosphatidylglycerol synthetase-like protein (DUF2156 family)